MKTVALFSGGLDSTVMLSYLLDDDDPDQVIALSFNYGQRHGMRELLAAEKIAANLGIQHEVVDVRDLRRFLSGSLVGDDPVPEGHYEDETMKVTVVPNRNMIMLSMAAGYAMSLNFDRVAYAAHVGDHAIYPDCRKEFVDVLREAIGLAHWSSVGLLTPFGSCDKKTIVEIGRDLEAPFGDTWSCYKGGVVHCGVCGTCVERREAFKLAGVSDPTVYQGRSNVPSSEDVQI